ncbi:protein FAM221A isoform X4 [Triplophysa dalaica]|uniref:protein FAM221A isoform X4 n=1 Tax=Triplophysa dalaica TaxID=1582913 RepID=UPI0024DF4B3B|nr:protein FAM221A isoform X4 [Triplophysa dalaica]
MTDEGNNNILKIKSGMERIRIDKQATNAVDAFLEYRRYKQHCTDFEELPKERPILQPCRARGCQCVSYQYAHMNGSRPVRCQCKHATNEHSESPGHPCKKCSQCSGYRSPFTCGCGKPGYAHVTLVETKEERVARGHPVGRDVPYAAMGGLTGFSSLADGYLRLDPSGIGPLSYSTLESDSLESDQVFERASTSLSQTAVHEMERKCKQKDGRSIHLSGVGQNITMQSLLKIVLLLSTLTNRESLKIGSKLELCRGLRCSCSSSILSSAQWCFEGWGRRRNRG